MGVRGVVACTHLTSKLLRCVANLPAALVPITSVVMRGDFACWLGSHSICCNAWRFCLQPRFPYYLLRCVAILPATWVPISSVAMRGDSACSLVSHSSCCNNAWQFCLQPGFA